MPSITRRQFLEESMIAAAAAAAVCTPQARAEEEAPRAANDTIVHAVIGCRIRGRVHANEFAKQAGVEIGYVCDHTTPL